VVALRQPARHSVSVPDARGGDRFVRVTAHADRGLVTVSHWERNVCVAADAVPIDDLAPIIDLLTRAARHLPPPSSWPAPSPTARRAESA
jgi:hypothetical protein